MTMPMVLRLMWRDGAVPYEAAKYLSILLNDS
jgi:hypothetical protein